MDELDVVPNKMPLQSEAQKLLDALRATVRALNNFQHPNDSDYALKMAGRLEPLVDELDRAVTVLRSKSAATGILDDIQPLMHNISGATGIGDLRIFPEYDDKTLETYWRLHTIFRDSRFAAESL